MDVCVAVLDMFFECSWRDFWEAETNMWSKYWPLICSHLSIRDVDAAKKRFIDNKLFWREELELRADRLSRRLMERNITIEPVHTSASRVQS